ncbi:MAG: branched-chain amino acid ABC transporter permease [Betaproteobacteria bacterium]|jgi:branched-chain amino acid transport system permease protein
MDIFLQQMVNGLLLGSIYALVALGYTMVYGILGLINFAHGDIVMVGAMVTLSTIGVLEGHLPIGVILLVACLVAIVVCVLMGLLLERVAYRPLRHAPRLAPLITAIGVSLLIQYSAALIWGKQYIALPELFKPSQYVWAGVEINALQIFIFVLALLIMASLALFVKHTRLGRAMQATEQNADSATLMGVNTTGVIALTFAIGAAIGAVAGVMIDLYYGQAHYFMGFLLGLKAFTAAVLGGIGHIGGAMLGGLLLGVIESLSAGYIGDLTGGLFGSNYRDVFTFFVLIGVLMLRPSGLLGRATTERA